MAKLTFERYIKSQGVEHRTIAIYTMKHLARVSLLDLAAHRPDSNLEVSSIDAHFGGEGKAGGAELSRELRGKAVNRLGERRCATYFAKDRGRTVGFLTTAEDYSSNPIAAALKSYFWLVNMVVHPDYQRQGVATGMLNEALQDPMMPRHPSLLRYPSAYPLTSNPSAVERAPLPGEAFLDKFDFKTTDPAFETPSQFFGQDVWLQRQQGPLTPILRSRVQDQLAA
jgi:GNAT superfamily N-acetyltransferase